MAGTARAALLTAMLMALSACATPKSEAGTPAPAPAPAEPQPTASACDADAARGVIGQVATAERVEEARLAAGAQVARTLEPGQMVTMEYHPSRLNLDVDEANVVTQVRCG